MATNSSGRREGGPAVRAGLPASILAVALSVGATAAARPGDEWDVSVAVGDVLHLSGWDESAVEVRGGLPERAGAFDVQGETGFGNGAYLSVCAGLDRHWQLGGFLYYTALGTSVARNAADDVFWRAPSVLGVGASVRGGDRVHRVIWIGAALDAGLAVVFPGQATLPRAGAHLELGDWYGLFLFPRVHVDIRTSGRGDPKVGFFWDFGPLLVPYAAGTGRGAQAGTDLTFGFWAVGLQMVVGFLLGG